MTEKLLQFIWGFGYFNKSSLATTKGEPLQIIFPGSLNKNQGPDFSSAKIRLGNTTFAGNVELHLKTSDWIKHGHESDANYRNVILHVVYEHDVDVNNIPVFELSPRVSVLLLNRYESFMNNASFIPCGGNIVSAKELIWKGWKERLLVERLSRKAEHVLCLFEASNCHWEETFWWMLARAFGGKINGDAFEAMARSVPVNLLSKHKTSLHQLESLLLGQTNLLNDAFEEDYPKLLQREYRFLKSKYNLQPTAVPVLLLRMRPGNFPTVRLAQLAALVHQTTHLFSRIIEAQKLGEITDAFAVAANDFWHYHYTLKEASSFKKKTIGADMADNVIINTVVPVLFAYGLYRNEEKYKDKALRWLDETSAEVNRVTKGFEFIGIKNRSAYDSQALLELRNEYCSEKRCLNCSVGNHLLREAAADYQPASGKLL
ncbi:DUF2851 family protein [Flavisolibacter ginsenosidimutans]|uniref:DUF2851 family protein n=1 Tax=Flavisolibacter ginsenosidimutans TaxID=661481 RepID=A0A5B8UEU5_9BACT|nr:DUF2851 family protein [Flavisolibacter ginsenosidimutans]QEC54952.1 DUF2851 family protein [Flavisolibacter ginsenosidimutans]